MSTRLMNMYIWYIINYLMVICERINHDANYALLYSLSQIKNVVILNCITSNYIVQLEHHNMGHIKWNALVQ